jgi:DNA processing protein
MFFSRLNSEIKVIEKESELFPKNLKALKDCPKRIYLLGNDKILNEPSIAIVGTRKSTRLGNNITSSIAESLSKNGIIIVSGGACGIDSSAHLASCNNYKTIAYVAGGFNNILRDDRLALAKRIIESDGAVISEYDIDYPVQSYMFLNRNRLIATHSDATIVVEAPFKSGALNTANHAIKFKKPLFAVPWNLGYENGIGCNNLIKNGARLLTSYKDVLKELSIAPQISFNEILDNNNSALKVDDEYLHYYNYIKELSSASINDIYSFFTSIPVSDINSDLLMMEINGYIKQDSMGNYSINDDF